MHQWHQWHQRHQRHQPFGVGGIGGVDGGSLKPPKISKLKIIRLDATTHNQPASLPSQTQIPNHQKKEKERRKATLSLWFGLVWFWVGLGWFGFGLAVAVVAVLDGARIEGACTKAAELKLLGSLVNE